MSSAAKVVGVNVEAFSVEDELPPVVPLKSVPCNCPKGSLSKVRKEVRSAKLCTCREGPNTGRQFWKCWDCKVFIWVDGQPNITESAGSATGSAAGSAVAPTAKFPAPICLCNKSSRLLTTKKEGPNLHRKFYTCPDRVCNSFSWQGEWEVRSSRTNV